MRALLLPLAVALCLTTPRLGAQDSAAALRPAKAAAFLRVPLQERIRLRLADGALLDGTLAGRGPADLAVQVITSGADSAAPATLVPLDSIAGAEWWEPRADLSPLWRGGGMGSAVGAGVLGLTTYAFCHAPHRGCHVGIAAGVGAVLGFIPGVVFDVFRGGGAGQHSPWRVHVIWPARGSDVPRSEN